MKNTFGVSALLQITISVLTTYSFLQRRQYGSATRKKFKNETSWCTKCGRDESRMCAEYP